MSTAIAPRVKRHSPEDLLRSSRGEHCELIDGRMVEKPSGSEADWIGVQVAHRLGNFVEPRRLGWVFGPLTGYQCFPDDCHKVRKPDVSFVIAARLPGGVVPKGHMVVSPDLAVEVISPRELYLDVESKLEDYLRAGIPLIWVVAPESRTIKVYADGDARPQLQRESDQLTGGCVLPGFECPVAALFPPRVTASSG